jgi:hypothetical protein
MVEILNFKKAATVIKLNTTVTNLNVQGILMSHCGRDKNMENNHLAGKCNLPNLCTYHVINCHIRGSEVVDVGRWRSGHTGDVT